MCICCTVCVVILCVYVLLCVVILRVYVVLCVLLSYVYMLYIVCCYLMCICCTVCVVILRVYVVLIVLLSYVYMFYCVCCYLMCICCTVWALLFYLFFFFGTLDAGLLARSQYSEGLATGHLDTGFSSFPCAEKQMLRWLPRFQVATTCFSCSPPYLNLVVNNFIFCIHVK